MITKSVTSGHNQATIHKEASPFGKELLKARHKLSWTRSHLSKKSKVHENTIYNIEKGKTTENFETRRILTE
ncbi:MAG: helix-turn-helix domain-containing protein, partial [Gloeomargaritales cyanobacterium]